MNRIVNIIKNNFLLYLSMFLLLSNYMLLTAFQWQLSESYIFLKTPLRLFVILLLFFHLFKQGKVKIIFIFLVIYSVLLFFINTNEFLLNILFLFLFFTSFLNVKQDDSIFLIFVYYLFYFMVHNLLLFSGVLSNEVSNIGERIRSGFGFTNVNRLGMFYFYFFIISFFMIIRNKVQFNLSSLGFVLCCIISLIFIKLSDSRTAFYCCMLMVFLYLLGRFKIILYIQRLSVNFLFPLCFFISLYLASNAGMVYNSVLSYRSTFFNQYIDLILSKDSYVLFGMPIIEDLTIDNSYLLFIGAVGLFNSILFALLSPFIIYKRFLPEGYILLIIVVLLYGVFESNLLRVEMLVPVVVLYSMLFGKSQNYNS